MRAILVTKHETMSRTVHGFQTELLTALGLNPEHILLVLLIVTRDLEKITVENVRCHDFVVSTIPVLITNEMLKTCVHSRTVRKKEGTSGRQIVHEKQTLTCSRLSMIELFLLLDSFLVPVFEREARV